MRLYHVPGAVQHTACQGRIYVQTTNPEDYIFCHTFALHCSNGLTSAKYILFLGSNGSRLEDELEDVRHLCKDKMEEVKKAEQVLRAEDSHEHCAASMMLTDIAPCLMIIDAFMPTTTDDISNLGKSINSVKVIDQYGFCNTYYRSALF